MSTKSQLVTHIESLVGNKYGKKIWSFCNIDLEKILEEELSNSNEPILHQDAKDILDMVIQMLAYYEPAHSPFNDGAVEACKTIIENIKVRYDLCPYQKDK